MWFEATAPGSLLLLGEYAVLSGKLAIVGAINHRLRIILIPRIDNTIQIVSRLGHYETTIDRIEIVSPFEYVLTAIAFLNNKNKLASGFELVIDGNCESGMGLGSSAAVTVATLAVIHQWYQQAEYEKSDLWHSGLQVIHQVAGCGSGADLAASIYGGVIAFKNKPFHIEHLTDSLPICAIYSGNKLKTAEAIARVKNYRAQQPEFFAALDEAIAQLSLAAIPAIKNQDWPSLGLLWNWAHELMQLLAVSNTVLNTLVTALLTTRAAKIFGAKISGSGFGDCVIGLGELAPDTFPNQIPVSIAPIGITSRYDRNIDALPIGRASVFPIPSIIQAHKTGDAAHSEIRSPTDREGVTTVQHTAIDTGTV